MPEKERQTTLAEYEILDSLPEKEFDDIVELASAICGTPISAISLLDLDRQWFKSQIGLDTNQTPIEQSYCRYAAEAPDEVMVVSDSLKDDRFKNNPLTLGDPHIRFYAGAPLVTDEGVALGALCVIDREPRQFTEQEKRMLKVLAKRVMRLLELRKENLSQQKAIASTTEQLDITLEHLFEAQKTAQIGNWDWNMKTGEVYWSPQIYELMAPHTKPGSIKDRRAWESLIHPDDLPSVRQSIETLLTHHKPTRIEFRVNSMGKEKWLLRTSDVKLNTTGEVVHIFGIMQDITERKNAEKNQALYSKTLESILFDLSHKIRKPLTTLLGLMPILESEGTSKENLRQANAYFRTSLKELEAYTRELNERLQQIRKEVISLH